MSQQTRVWQLRRRWRRQPRPDFTGMTAEQILVWAAENGQYEEIVALALRDHRPKMVTAEDREAELRAAGQWPAAEPGGTAVSQPEEDKPAPPDQQPEVQRAYWEEKCRWRLRTPEDYAEWESDDDQVEHEYDPLADDDYDPFHDLYAPLRRD